MSTAGSPKVTVLMSAFNSDRYVGGAIESILGQTFSDFEFIIYDDGSTDGTSEIIKGYEAKDRRIKAYYKDKNTGFPGIIENLNSGMEIARGRYIARMDADDISLPERLQTEADFLDANPDTFLVGSGAINIDEAGKTLSTFKPITDPGKLKERLERVAAIYNPTVMFRSGSGLKYIDLRGTEDYHFFLMAIKRGLKLANIPDTLIHYRILAPSLSHGNPYQRLMHTLVAQDLYFGTLQLDAVQEDLIDERYNPDKCSKETLMRMVEVAYLSRSYDIIFKVATVYTERFGISLKIVLWEATSGLKMLLKRFF